MSDENPDVMIPEDEQAVIDFLEEELGGELTEQEENLAVAQAKLIGDL